LSAVIRGGKLMSCPRWVFR